MLTLHHPELMHTVLNYPIGLYVLTIKGNNRSALVVKANKEALLASQLNKGFKMYVVPMDVGGKITVGIMSAFFDDCDEPLVIYTTLFDDAASTLLKQVVLGGELYVHLFDECNRELLGYSALVRVPPITRVHLEQAHFLPFEQATARAMLDKLPVWFGLRNVLDDAAAIAVDFGETLFPDDLFVFIQDLRPEHHTRVPCIALDYSELNMYTAHLASEEDFFEAYNRVFTVGVERKEFPRLRFWVGDSRTNS